MFQRPRRATREPRPPDLLAHAHIPFTWTLKILSTLRPVTGFSNFCKNWSLRDEYEWCCLVRTLSVKSSDGPPRKVLST